MPRLTVPTLPILVENALQLGSDRVSYVRQPDVSRSAGIFILMLSTRALREVGPVIRRYAASMQVPERLGHTHGLIVEMKQSVGEILEYLDKAKNKWAWGQYQIQLQVMSKGHSGNGLMVLTTAAFVGTEVCRRLAKDLTRAGCYTKL
jgi:hypothetical protein